MPKILIVDDETAILEALQLLLRREGYEVAAVQGGREALVYLEETTPDLVLTDIRMPGVSGLDLLTSIRGRDPDLPVILMTAQASLRSAMQAVNEGAFYYLMKPFSNDELLALCQRATEARTLKVENRALRREIGRRAGPAIERPVGQARAFVDLLELVEIVAPSDSTVLITGESGTGKDVLARYTHSLSDRREGPFISINCGALPENLLESELFGHIKGSFTGAVRDKDGLLVAAEGGTFFLDEVGEMTPALQVKLLRAIQEREVIPVGATEPIPIDVRIIAATNRDLEEEVRRGTFRTDLYYRLNVISLHLPPLRERVSDIALLAEHFLRELSERAGGQGFRLSETALRILERYDWPGNTRELENALERAVVLARGEVIDTELLPTNIVEERPALLVDDRPPENPTLEVIERAYIQWVLQSEGGNRARTAEVLGIDPSTLYRKLNRYGIS